MKRVHAIVVCAVLLFFGVAFALPGVDSPGTSYDESETQPYDCAPQVSSAMAHVAGPASQIQRNSSLAKASAELPLDLPRLVLPDARGLTLSPRLATQALPIRC